jgi:hypothetical protein
MDPAIAKAAATAKGRALIWFLSRRHDGAAAVRPHRVVLVTRPS